MWNMGETCDVWVSGCCTRAKSKNLDIEIIYIWQGNIELYCTHIVKSVNKSNEWPLSSLLLRDLLPLTILLLTTFHYLFGLSTVYSLYVTIPRSSWPVLVSSCQVVSLECVHRISVSVYRRYVPKPAPKTSLRFPSYCLNTVSCHFITHICARRWFLRRQKCAFVLFHQVHIR